MPKDPLPGAMSQIRIKFMDNAFYQGLKEEFDKRPIWSKNALQVWLGYSKDKLKVCDLFSSRLRFLLIVHVITFNLYINSFFLVICYI